MLKLLQLTDCHLMPEGGRLFELDPAERLAAAISDINRNHSDAALCVLTGDLTNVGDPDSYALLRDRLAALSVPYQLLLGNHDDREHMRAAFPDLVVDPHGFLQSVRITPQGRLVFLDTVEAGVHNGVYCADRLIWLEHVLTESKGEPVYIFMHHPPMLIAMSRLDQYGLVDREAFADLIRRFPNIRHIFFGHVHRPVSGGWLGIPFSSLPSTNHQNQLDFGTGRENLSSHEPPAYAVIFLDGDQSIVHLHGFLDASAKFVYDPAAAPENQIRKIS
jgi:Icc protein